MTTQFLAASSEYWDVKAGTLDRNGDVVEHGYDQLANEKRRLLALPGSDRILVSKPFSHGAKLKISLKGLGKLAYQLRASADRADANGQVLLEVR